METLLWVLNLKHCQMLLVAVKSSTGFARLKIADTIMNNIFHHVVLPKYIRMCNTIDTENCDVDTKSGIDTIVVSIVSHSCTLAKIKTWDINQLYPTTLIGYHCYYWL